ncbi:MAG: extracellular solute-binding protein [Chloroflexi bacterium]|nr:extracellular solute-binding protein [Chloroflexota bacterium]MCI0643955.1 extracellular solute-binding protein [Chloroflexota bacterium]
MRKTRFLLVALLIVLALLLVACGGGAGPTPTAEEPAAEEPAAEEPAAEEPAAEDTPTEAPAAEEPEPTTAADQEPAESDKVQIRWFVGLGAGSDAPTIEPQQAVVDKFNASQNEIELVLEIVDNDVAYDTLATQIAGGNAPDIVGPVGIRGRDSFKGAWLDLQPLIDTNGYDLSVFDPEMVQFYHVQEEGQLGIPFAIFPSFVIYNIDLFDEAGLAYPPHEYGAPYIDADGNEHEWNIDTLTDLALQLTVDADGNDATSPDFDPTNIVQFGWQNQWTDPRGIGTFFGPGSFVAADGSAQIPEEWLAAWEWTYDGWWTSWFTPNGPYGGAEFLQGPGGPFSSGNLAMVHLHLWYVATWALGEADFAFDLAATPSYNGHITSKMHADTFGILKNSQHPEEAFQVMTYLLSPEIATELLNIYGGMPARLELQEEWLANYFETNFPGQNIDKQVVLDSIVYADNPNHESWMPSFLETTDRYNEFWNRLANEPDLDFQAEVDQLLVDLNAIFAAAEE